MRAAHRPWSLALVLFMSVPLGRTRSAEGEAFLSEALQGIDAMIFIRRRADQLGLPMNWEGNSSLPRTGYQNEIIELSRPRPSGKRRTLFQSEGGRFVGDLDLHFDASRMLVSMPGANGRWQVHELSAGGKTIRELRTIEEPDVDNYDACYLPSGAILFTSTATITGVPCVRGASHVANLYRLEPSGAVRRLTVDQEHDWCPTVLNDGRVLYQRWEYTDTPHAFNRILFHMNPDGTGQAEFYGSNSYWPNALFYARPIPGERSKFIAIVGGHHDNPRMGELVLFDAARGRFEADGALQRIPGREKRVEPILKDGLTLESWPKFLHPFPLSATRFLVSCKPSPKSPWGIYLADTDDRLVLIQEEPGWALFEPVPLRRTPRPPIVPDRVDLERKDALVFLQDVYAGPAMRGVARGTVKALRLVGYSFAYYGMGGQIDRVGFDGPWDVKRIVGTVPVADDGSAYFRVPAMMPLSVQPLDAEGKAVQLMRSWFTAMPGEVLSCSGCHEPQNRAPSSHGVAAATHARVPSEIVPWRGPERGFAFDREVQPVLDRHCVRCHDGRGAPPDLTRRPVEQVTAGSPDYSQFARFSPAYTELRRFVRTPTIEGDLHTLAPREFHADTTLLVQLLAKGHAGVELDAESWDRLVTWIDLGAPAHGSWTEVCGESRVKRLAERRRELRLRYAGVDLDEEAAPATAPFAGAVPSSIGPAAPLSAGEEVSLWPFGAEAARAHQGAGGHATTRSLPFAPGVAIALVRIPAGALLLGDPEGETDERPAARVQIERAFWMGRTEVTNAQYALYDPTHRSGIEHIDFLHFDERERGYTLEGVRQPVVRVSWLEAMRFCRWLSERVGLEVTLPTEAEWEWAARAGSAAPLWWGGLDEDFSRLANLSDRTHRSVETLGWGLPSGAIPPWRPADDRFDDHFRVSAPVASFQPNPWGLVDVHGNVAEWTRSAHRSYPYVENDGRNVLESTERRVARGGSWYDRPKDARSARREAYWPDQKVFDVGFRVIVRERQHTTP